MVVLLKFNVIGDDYIEVILDENNSCFKINKKEGLVDKILCVYMFMNYKFME